LSKKNDTSCDASELRSGTGAVAVDVEAVVVVGVDVDVSTLSVVGLLGTGINSPDARDIGVIGCDGILDPTKDH
jgi:hypothetical protein